MESLNEMGGEATLRPPSLRTCNARLEQSVVAVPECPTNLTAADVINHILGHDCDYLDEFATGHLSSYQRGRVSLPRVPTEMKSCRSFYKLK